MQLQVTAYPRENALRLGIGSGRTSKHTHTHIYGLLQSFYATLFHIISYFVLLQLLPCPPPSLPHVRPGLNILAAVMSSWVTGLLAQWFLRHLPGDLRLGFLFVAEL